jgi:hypothetical protein
MLLPNVRAAIILGTAQWIGDRTINIGEYAESIPPSYATFAPNTDDDAGTDNVNDVSFASDWVVDLR